MCQCHTSNAEKLNRRRLCLCRCTTLDGRSLTENTYVKCMLLRSLRTSNCFRHTAKHKKEFCCTCCQESSHVGHSRGEGSTEQALLKAAGARKKQRQGFTVNLVRNPFAHGETLIGAKDSRKRQQTRALRAPGTLVLKAPCSIASGNRPRAGI